MGKAPSPGGNEPHATGKAPDEIRLVLPWSVLVSDNEGSRGLLGDRDGWRARRDAKAEARRLAGEQYQGAPIAEPVEMTVVLWPPDRRQRDAANPVKCLCDALSGVVYVDDYLVAELHVSRRAPDPENARADVLVTRCAAIGAAGGVE